MSAGTRFALWPMIARPTSRTCCEKFVGRQLDAKARDGLELVERAARVAEPAAAHLPERHAAGGDDRTDGERGLVPHAAGRVLVDHLAAERRAELDRLAAADHRVRQRERLVSVQAAEIHRHAKRSHLVVRDLAARVARARARDSSSVRESLAVALAADQLSGMDHERTVSARRSAGRGSRATGTCRRARRSRSRRRPRTRPRGSALPRSCLRRTRAAARARASGRSTASSGRSRGRT